MQSISKTPLVTVSAALIALLGAASASASDAERGALLYEAAGCASCHGPTGLGDGPVGEALEALDVPPGDWSTPEAFQLDTDGDGRPGSPRDLANVIERGALVFGGSAMMGPTQGLDDADVADLVAFIRSLSD